MNESTSLLLQNRLLTEEVKRRVDQIAAINTVAATVGNSLDLDATLHTALQAVVDVVGAEAAGISLIDEDAGEIVLRAQLGWVHDFVKERPMRIPMGRGMSGQVIENDDMVVHNNLDGTEDYAVPSFREEHFRSIAMAPMHSRGEIIGILSIMSHRPDRFDHDVVEVLRAIADTVGAAIGNAKLYEQHVEQEKRLDAILQATADGIIATDRYSKITLVNYAAEQLLELKAEDLEGVPLRKAPMHPRVRNQLLMALSIHEQRGDNEAFEVELENGRVLAVTISPVYVESQVEQDEHMDGWVLVLRDITHLREAEIARAEFIQAAAHDMRNPLSVTQSSLNMLATMIRDDNQAGEMIEIAQSGINRLQQLIEDLFNLEQIESGANFHLSEVNVLELCQEVSAEIRGLILSKKIAFQYHIDDNVPQFIVLDRRWISRAIHNYLENAVKYSPENSEVQLIFYTQGTMLHIEVTDNGPGIPPDAQPRVFDRFYRVNQEDKKGTGLGLAIVKSVAEAHDGSVYVRSKPKQGSTFGIRIPIRQED
ncbi:MAG: PAS domain S-box protein [Chloroflexi bacterium]|nr:MAG: PAS domain S-box protein [Chloroflexota bacterium]